MNRVVEYGCGKGLVCVENAVWRCGDAAAARTRNTQEQGYPKNAQKRKALRISRAF
jgi:hypothetical protein